jgi:hypothetical protein
VTRALTLILVLLSTALSVVAARDLDGRWAQTNPVIHDWFRSLRNEGNAYCCDGADGQRIADPDWGIDANGYWVRLDNGVQRVTADQLVTAKNRVGYAIVWAYDQPNSKVRCFMPGATG